jgi:2-polyprenyl-3-methyl-5-hydroxy-6-metoxy-1,4-benzoquinol methylase
MQCTLYSVQWKWPQNIIFFVHVFSRCKTVMKTGQKFSCFRVPFIRDGLLNVGHTDLSKWRSPKPLYGMKILEVGCGGGILAEVCVMCRKLSE